MTDFVLLSDLKALLDRTMDDTGSVTVSMKDLRCEGASSDRGLGRITRTMDTSFGPVKVTTWFEALGQNNVDLGWYCIQEPDRAGAGVITKKPVLDDLLGEDEPGYMKPLDSFGYRMREIADDAWSYWDFEPWCNFVLTPRVQRKGSDLG